ncbi:hypothetical protein A5713_10790 [Mycobacterium sp. E2497]|nr:hypothetical protein A5713_10790 [Mycobacterium sp. E2497]
MTAQEADAISPKGIGASVADGIASIPAADLAVKQRADSRLVGSAITPAKPGLVDVVQPWLHSQ